VAKYEIGGFFGLELAQRQPLHADTLALNSGRNALRLLLRAGGVSRIHIPVFSCPALIPSIQAEGVAVSYYRVTADLEPADLEPPAADEAILLINYFGLKDATMQRYASAYNNVIVDQCQALFSSPLPGLGSIYSPRKFVGVADGGYLSSGLKVAAALPVGESSQRYQHCLKRIDAGAPAAYTDYQSAETLLSKQTPALMSRLTRSVLASIDYGVVSQRRRENFTKLHASLSDLNQLSLEFDEQAVPMAYPFVIDAPGLREHLIEQGIYVACYWPDPDGLLPGDPVREMLSSHLLALPIDQRYGASEMQLIAELVVAYLSSAGMSAQSVQAGKGHA
jgi:hypothetical protein